MMAPDKEVTEEVMELEEGTLLSVEGYWLYWLFKAAREEAVTG
jgi:hypothetical protein